MTAVPFIVAAWLFLSAMVALATNRDMIRLIVCLLVMQSSTYIFLLCVGYVSGAKAPVYADVAPGTRAVDPVVQALTLTDIVVATTVTGLLLSMVLQVYKIKKTLDPSEVRPLDLHE